MSCSSVAPQHRDGGLVSVEALARALAPVAHLRVVHRHEALRRGALLQGGAVLLAVNVLSQHPAQQPGRGGERRVLGTVRHQLAARDSDLLQQPVGIRDDLPQEPLARRRVVPRNGRSAFQTHVRDGAPIPRRRRPRGELVAVATRATGHPRLPRQHPQHGHDPVGQQVVGVLDRAPSEDGRGVQGHLEFPVACQFPAPLRQFQALLEQQARLLVDDELRPELLQRALGERLRVHVHAQRHLPAQVVRRPLRRFVVGDALVGLQHQRRRQQTGRHARPPPPVDVERQKQLVREQRAPLAAQPAVERVSSDEVGVQRVRLEQPPLRAALAQHRGPVSSRRADSPPRAAAMLAGCDRAPHPTFRPDF